VIDSILILAAGKGERLGELTKNTPKPLLRIDKSNTTILDRLIHQCMREFPYIPVHINISYLADSFLRHFSSRSLDVTPKFLFEKRVLGPAKTLQEFQKLGFHKTLVIHGDLVLADLDFTNLALRIKSSNHQLIVSHLRPLSRARSRVNSELSRVISIEEYESDDLNNFSDQVVSVCSGIYSIFAKSIRGYQAQMDESLAPNLLNYSIQNQETHEFLWHDWRFAVDSPEIYLRVKDQISRQD
jgi:NDP-sugar pyrophosphorylase family protein